MEYESIRINKTDYLKNLDQLKFSSWHQLVVACLGLTWVFDGYEVSMLSLTSQELKKYFDIDDTHIGWIASVYLSGGIVGALLFGYMAQNYGRKHLFATTLYIYIFSVISLAFANSFWFFLCCRFLTGVSVGGEFSAIFVTIDELIPSASRGQVDIILDGSWHLGSFFSSIMSIIVYSYIDEWQNELWRGLFVLAGICALPLIHYRSMIPESPRWLIMQGNESQANLVIDYIIFCVENNQIYDEQKMENINKQITKGENDFKKDFFYLLRRTFMKYPQRFYLCFVLMVSQAFFYQGIFYTFGMMLQEFYHVENKNVGYYMIPLSVASFMGTILFGPLFDSLGRQKMITFTYGFSAILLTITSICFKYDLVNLQCLMILWFLTFLIASPGASSANLTISEVFPVQMRSQLMAIFFATGQAFGGVIAPTFFGYLITQKSRSNISLGYLLSAFMMIIGGITGYFYAVDAEKKSLEEISQ